MANMIILWKKKLTDLQKQNKGHQRCICRTRKGVVPYNKNKLNQDRAIVKFALADDADISLFGVFDGHGEFGHEVAQFVIDTLPKTLIMQKNLKNDPVNAVIAGTMECAAELKKHRDQIDFSFSGTTAVFGLKVGSTLYVGNAGDSRCVLGRLHDGHIEAVALSEDNKPDQSAEKQRILDAGGRVEPLPGPPEEDLGPMRVWLQDADHPGLAMSRSIGDEVAQTVGVISEPVVVTHPIENNDQFVIWASDGVWEFIPNQLAAEIIWKHKDNLEEAAQKIISEANKRWQEEEDVVDDITCVILFFR